MVFLGAFECSYVYFTRECDHWQISHGIRKEPWQREAIHYCFTAIAYDYFRRYVPIKDGFNCQTEGEDYFLQGGAKFSNGTHTLPYALCTTKKDHKLLNCSMPETKFSFMKGFDIMYNERVLRKIVSAPTPDDYTAFRIELCDLQYAPYRQWGRK
ncbi:uncharacterized protein LOC111135690 [Crassostrea virginica]